MKKVKAIIAAVAAATILTAVPAQAAVEMYNPIIREFMPAEIASTSYSDFSYKDLYNNGSDRLVLGIKTDEEGNVINDTYNSSNDKYWYVPKDTTSGKLNVFSTCGTGYNMYSGNSGDEISRYATIYGKAHNEVIIRFTDSACDKDALISSNDFGVYGFTESGKNVFFKVYPYYLCADGSIQIWWSDGTNKAFLGWCYPEKWSKFAIDVDVPNDVIEFSVTDLSNNTERVVKKRLSDCGEKVTNVVCGTRMRFGNNLYGVSIAKVATVRDTFVVNDFSVTDTEKVTASAKMANHGATSGNYRFNIVNSDGTQTVMYDDKAVANLCTKTPMLILAQYDSEGRLLDCKFNKPESLTSTFGSGQFYINPTHVEKAGDETKTEKVDWQNVSIECDKAAGYSYAKAYVWTGLDTQKPYLESVSTKTE